MLILLRGLPGSGKSTFAKKLLEAKKASKHFEADMFFIDPKTNTYKFEPQKIKEAHEWCQKNVRDCLSRGETVVVSNTFTKKWEMDPYLKMIPPEELKVYHLKTQFKNIHEVPDESIKKMKERWETFPGEEFVE